MQWYRDLKTVTKLMMGFGIMALFMGVLGYQGVRSIRAVNTETSSMYEHHLLGLTDLKDANLQLTTAGKSIRNAMLTNDAKDLEVRVGELHANRDAFLADIEEFKKRILLDATRVKTAALLEEYYINAREQDKVVEMLRDHKREQAIAHLSVLNTLQKKREDLMAELMRDKLNLVKQAVENVGATARASETATITVVAMAVALALVMGFLIARAITRPLGKMVEAATKLAAGDVSQTIDYAAKDETGKLAQALSLLVATLQRLTAETGRLVGAAREGRLDTRGDEAQFSGAFRDLVQGMNATQDAFSAPVKEASSVLAKVAGRDLTAQMEGHYKGDFAAIQSSLNAAVANLREALTEVRTSADSVASTAGALSAASDHISSGAQEQASSLEETASSLEEITATVKQNAESARQASQLSAGSRDAAEKGGQVVTSAVAAMTEINQASKRIADIITTIDEIAFQTNLLALNAAVEAARAGEQGRGFAVVAAEVRNLAQRSATAAKEIKALIQDSVRKVESGSELVNRSGHTLEEIVQSIKRVTDIVAEIAAASQEQSAGIEQVNKATMQMDQVTQSNASQTEEMASTAQGLSSGAEQLLALVGSFQLGTQVAAPPAKTTAAVRSVPARRKGAQGTTLARAPHGSRAVENPHGDQPALAALALHTAGSSHASSSDNDEFEEF